MIASPLTGWAATRWERLNGGSRVRGVDLARGLAVVGMFAAHMFALPDFEWTDATTWGGVADGRSAILFATLAGVSLALMTGGAQPLTGDALNRARGRIGVRAGLIWILGAALIATRVPILIILPAYAILFVLALPFLGLRARTLFAWAAGVAVIMPFIQVWLDALPLWLGPRGAALSLLVGWHYPFPVWAAFVLCGMAIGRLDLRSLRVQTLLVTGGAVAAAVGYGLDAAVEGEDPFSVDNPVWTAYPHSSGVLEVIGSGGFAVAVIGLCLVLCRTWIVWLALPLRATGTMPLSAYTAQLVGWAIVAALVLEDRGDLAGFRDLDPFVPFTVWTIVGCTAWAMLIGRGPLEAAVDRVSREVTRPTVGRVPR